MKKSLIIYNSRTGTTKRFGEEIHEFLIQKNIQSQVIPISEFHAEAIHDCDYLFLGAWTHGMMIFLQHPEKKWVEFTQKLPELKNKKIILFTTYKLATGRMFAKMRAKIHCNVSDICLELKSRNGHLNDSQKDELEKIMTVVKSDSAVSSESVPV